MKPVVGIVMGSISDWETTKAAAKVLEEFAVAMLALSNAKLQNKLSAFRTKQTEVVLKTAPLKL